MILRLKPSLTGEKQANDNDNNGIIDISSDNKLLNYLKWIIRGSLAAVVIGTAIPGINDYKHYINVIPQFKLKHGHHILELKNRIIQWMGDPELLPYVDALFFKEQEALGSIGMSYQVGVPAVFLNGDYTNKYGTTKQSIETVNRALGITGISEIEKSSLRSHLEMMDLMKQMERKELHERFYASGFKYKMDLDQTSEFLKNIQTYEKIKMMGETIYFKLDMSTNKLIAVVKINRSKEINNKTGIRCSTCHDLSMYRSNSTNFDKNDDVVYLSMTHKLGPILNDEQRKNLDELKETLYSGGFVFSVLLLIGFIVNFLLKKSASDGREKLMLTVKAQASKISADRQEKNIDNKLKKILDMILDVKQFGIKPMGSIGLLNLDGSKLIMRVHKGLHKEILSQCIERPAKDGVLACGCERAAVTNEVVIMKNCNPTCMNGKPNHGVQFDGMKPHGHILIPIRNKSGESIGVLNLYTEENLNVDDDIIAMLEHVAEMVSDLIQADEADRKEAFAEGIISTTMEAVISCNREGIINVWNKSAERIFGWQSSEVLGKSIEIMIPEDMLKLHRAGMQRVFEGGKPSIIGATDPVELEAITKDGKVIDIALRLGMDHRNRQVNATISDISRRKSNERTERKISEYMRNNTGPMFIFKKGLEPVPMPDSEAALNIMRGLQEEGRLVSSFVPEHINIDHIITYREKDKRFETRIGNNWYNFSLVVTENGEEALGFGTDITERKIVEALNKKNALMPELNPGPVIRLIFDKNWKLEVDYENDSSGEHMGEKWEEEFISMLEGVLPGDRLKNLALSKGVHKFEIEMNEKVFLVTLRGAKVYNEFKEKEEYLINPYLTDISDLKQTEANLKVALQQIEAERNKSDHIIEHLGYPFCTLLTESLPSDSKGIEHFDLYKKFGQMFKFTNVNKDFGKLLGKNVDDINGKPIFSSEIMTEENARLFAQEYFKAVQSGLKFIRLRMELKKADGSTITVDLNMTIEIQDDTGKLVPVVHLNDLTEQQRLESLSNTDALTGLNNRRYYEDHLLKLIPGAIRRSISRRSTDTGREYDLEYKRKIPNVLFIDLDYFKSVNDTFGHDAGDYALEIIGRRLKKIIPRSSDVVARPGGDEFIVIYHGTREEVEHIARQIILAISEDVQWNNELMAIGASIGICLFPFDGQNFHKSLEKFRKKGLRTKKEGSSSPEYDGIDIQGMLKEIGFSDYVPNDANIYKDQTIDEKEAGIPKVVSFDKLLAVAMTKNADLAVYEAKKGKDDRINDIDESGKRYRGDFHIFSVGQKYKDEKKSKKEVEKKGKPKEIEERIDDEKKSKKEVEKKGKPKEIEERVEKEPRKKED